MKKFLNFFLILSVLFCMIPTAQGAGTAKLTGPDTVVPGQTVTVAFYAWGDVLGGSGKVRYDPAQLTLERYQTASQEWQVDFMGDQFLFYADFLPPEHTPVFKATFRLSDSLAPGTQVSVTVCDLVVSDGKADSRLESISHTFKIQVPETEATIPIPETQAPTEATQAQTVPVVTQPESTQSTTAPTVPETTVNPTEAPMQTPKEKGSKDLSYLWVVVECAALVAFFIFALYHRKQRKKQ